jgi:hypothetical protein
MRRWSGVRKEPDSDDAQQQQALERCEVALFGGLRRQLEAGALVGAQLEQIRASGLYRAAGCDSFEVYCRKFLEMSAERARRLIELKEVVEMIRAANLELPVSETQAVMLGKIPRTRLTGCWRTVLAYCAREEIALSDAVVRRAMRFEIAREKQSSPSESVAEERAKKSCDGVKVTLEV